MSGGCSLFLAPAGGGKTAYALARCRAAAAGLAATPLLVVAGHPQVRAARRRLAEMGGALGVRVLTFDRLAAECLTAAGTVYLEISEAVQYRLLAALVTGMPLDHYAALAGRPGFIRVLQGLIGELEAAAVTPEALADALSAQDAPPRLAELAAIYTAYRARLAEGSAPEDGAVGRAWVDHAGLSWLAGEALAGAAPDVGRAWPLLILDGFDRFTAAQLGLLRGLAGRVGELTVTLTGEATAAGAGRPLVYRRFAVTRAELEQALGVTATALPPADGEAARPARASTLPLSAAAPTAVAAAVTPPDGSEQGPAAGRQGAGDERPAVQAIPQGDGETGQAADAAPALRWLAERLFRPEAGKYEAAGPAAPAVELIEAPDRAAEARAALRWLKARLLRDGLRPGEVALLARTITPYRDAVLQVAAEYGLPVRLADGLPLAANPAVAALLDLLRLMLPAADGLPALPWRPVLAAWRSPFFDWQARPAAEAQVPAAPRSGETSVQGGGAAAGISAGDADRLDAAARWSRVIGGLGQWEDALGRLAGRGDGETGDDEQDRPSGVPTGPAAAALLETFRRFVARLTPPPGAGRGRDFAGWLEDLIGEDPALATPWRPAAADTASLRVVACVRAGPAAIAERDLAALNALKDVLRGLVWAEDAVPPAQPVTFTNFFADLAGGVEAATYQAPIHPEREEILVAGVADARGLSFRAVAVLGLAEGEFPATLADDPFLRDEDRGRLRSEAGLPLASVLESHEAGYFYEAISQPRERLLLTRPRLADNGAAWQASPFWEEVRRLLDAPCLSLATDSLPGPDEAASWPELMRSLAAGCSPLAVKEWAAAVQPARWQALAAAGEVLAGRAGDRSPYDGDLAALADVTTERYGAGHVWSASRLETYRTCPFFFYVAHVLGLEPRVAPGEGLDARQLGTIYHRILEQVYGAVADPGDLDALLDALPAVAGRVLAEAPGREGFRATAWWAQTRDAIVENVRASLKGLAALGGAFVPIRCEAAFFGAEALTVTTGGGSFRLHGFIDRVDRAPDGRLRIIDYKTGGPSTYTGKALAEGKKLQLPLYALAARDALRLGAPAEGFYWHIHGPAGPQASEFSLAGVEGGPEAAMAAAAEFAWQAIVGVRAGRFGSTPPADGCPAYCPAAAFCWHYRAGFRA